MYALASGLVGFRSSSLRVRVLEHRDGCVWVRTADLADAGTALVLDESKVDFDYFTGDAEAPLVHRRGLVALG